jgi:hypothetical protein
MVLNSGNSGEFSLEAMEFPGRYEISMIKYGA